MFGIVDPYAEEIVKKNPIKEKKEKKEKRGSLRENSTSLTDSRSNVESRDLRLSRIPPPVHHDPEIVELAQRVAPVIELRDVFATTVGLNFFERMLLVEYAEENLLFWSHVQDVFAIWLQLLEKRTLEKEKLLNTDTEPELSKEVASIAITSPLTKKSKDSEANSKKYPPRYIPSRDTHQLVRAFRKAVRSTFKRFISQKSTTQVNLDSRTGGLVTISCEKLEKAALVHEPMLTWKLDLWPSMPYRYSNGDFVPSSLEDAFGAEIDEAMEALLQAASDVEELMRKDTFHRFRKHAYFVDFYVEAIRTGVLEHNVELGTVSVPTRVNSDNVHTIFKANQIEEPSTSISSIKSLSNYHKWAIVDTAKQNEIFQMFTPCTDDSTLLLSCIEVFQLKRDIFLGKASMEDGPGDFPRSQSVSSAQSSSSDVRATPMPPTTPAPTTVNSSNTSSASDKSDKPVEIRSVTTAFASNQLQPKPSVYSGLGGSRPYGGGFKASSNFRSGAGPMSNTAKASLVNSPSNTDNVPPPPPGPPPAGGRGLFSNQETSGIEKNLATRNGTSNNKNDPDAGQRMFQDSQ